MCSCDPSNEVAAVAYSTFEFAIPPKKREPVLIHMSVDILTFLHRNLLSSAEAFHDRGSSLSTEEVEDRHERILTSSLGALSRFISTLSDDGKNKVFGNDDAATVAVDTNSTTSNSTNGSSLDTSSTVTVDVSTKASLVEGNCRLFRSILTEVLSKLAISTKSNVRKAAYNLCTTLSNSIPKLVQQSISMNPSLYRAIMQLLEESDSNNISAMLETIISVSKSSPNEFWNQKKQMNKFIPKYKHLISTYPEQSLPCLLPLIGSMPLSVASPRGEAIDHLMSLLHYILEGNVTDPVKLQNQMKSLTVSEVCTLLLLLPWNSNANINDDIIISEDVKLICQKLCELLIRGVTDLLLVPPPHHLHSQEKDVSTVGVVLSSTNETQMIRLLVQWHRASLQGRNFSTEIWHELFWTPFIQAVVDHLLTIGDTQHTVRIPTTADGANLAAGSASDLIPAVQRSNTLLRVFRQVQGETVSPSLPVDPHQTITLSNPDIVVVNGDNNFFGIYSLLKRVSKLAVENLMEASKMSGGAEISRRSHAVVVSIKILLWGTVLGSCLQKQKYEILMWLCPASLYMPTMAATMEALLKSCATLLHDESFSQSWSAMVSNCLEPLMTLGSNYARHLMKEDTILQYDIIENWSTSLLNSCFRYHSYHMLMQLLRWGCFNYHQWNDEDLKSMNQIIKHLLDGEGSEKIQSDTKDMPNSTNGCWKSIQQMSLQNKILFLLSCASDIDHNTVVPDDSAVVRLGVRQQCEEAWLRNRSNLAMWCLLSLDRLAVSEAERRDGYISIVSSSSVPIKELLLSAFIEDCSLESGVVPIAHPNASNKHTVPSIICCWTDVRKEFHRILTPTQVNDFISTVCSVLHSNMVGGVGNTKVQYTEICEAAFCTSISPVSWARALLGVLNLCQCSGGSVCNIETILHDTGLSDSAAWKLCRDNGNHSFVRKCIVEINNMSGKDPPPSYLDQKNIISNILSGSVEVCLEMLLTMIDHNSTVDNTDISLEDNAFKACM